LSTIDIFAQKYDTHDMNIFQAILLAIVEGITEFLPISSTGHIIITERIFGIQNVNPIFDILIQVASISAAVWFFRARIGEISRESLHALKAKTPYKKMSFQQKYGIWILISIVPTLVIGFIFRKFVDQWQTSIPIITASTFIFGIIFYVIETTMKKSHTFTREKTTLPNLLVMGLAQSLAIIPGVSRSGATIAGGLTQKISMKDAVEFSFIMGIPVIYIAGLYKIVSNLSYLTPNILFETLVGCVVSFVVSLWAIKFSLGVLTKHGFKPFMIYRIGLSVALLVLYLAKII
jgi:undecaprenyl-diphosphatase